MRNSQITSKTNLKLIRSKSYTMTNVNVTLCFLTFFLCLAFSSCSRVPNSVLAGHADQKIWCIAQVSAPEYKLQYFIDLACSKYDCRPILRGGSCFSPNTLPNHASYALDLYYRHTGVCQPDIGTPAITDPSFGTCHYP